MRYKAVGDKYLGRAISIVCLDSLPLPSYIILTFWKKHYLLLIHSLQVYCWLHLKYRNLSNEHLPSMHGKYLAIFLYIEEKMIVQMVNCQALFEILVELQEIPWMIVPPWRLKRLRHIFQGGKWGSLNQRESQHMSCYWLTCRGLFKPNTSYSSGLTLSSMRSLTSDRLEKPPFKCRSRLSVCSLPSKTRSLRQLMNLTVSRMVMYTPMVAFAARNHLEILGIPGDGSIGVESIDGYPKIE